MAKKKGKKTNNTALFVIIAIVAVIVIVAVLVIFIVNPGGIKDKIMNVINGQKSNTNGSSYQSNLARGEGELQFHMINCGQGDCLLILLPDGKEMIVDAGSTSGGSYTNVKTHLNNYITDEQIDYVILTHTDQDHVEWVDNIIEDYQVDNIYMPALYSKPSNTTLQNKINDIPASKMAILNNSGVDESKAYAISSTYANFFIAAMSEPNCNIFLNIDIGAATDQYDTITSSDGTYSIQFFFMDLAFYNEKAFVTTGSTPKPIGTRMNAISPTMILEYNGRRIVLTGDANEINEPVYTQKLYDFYGGVIDCDVLKVAHHGSHEGSSTAYLTEVDPEYAMISCGTGNSYGHPRQVTLNRLKEYDNNMDLYRTDLHGTIVCVIDKDGNITITPTNTNVSDTDLWTGPQ